MDATPLSCTRSVHDATNCMRSLSSAVLCEVPLLTRPVIESPINFADCLIGSPISSQSTDPVAACRLSQAAPNPGSRRGGALGSPPSRRPRQPRVQQGFRDPPRPRASLPGDGAAVRARGGAQRARLGAHVAPDVVPLGLRRLVELLGRGGRGSRGGGAGHSDGGGQGPGPGARPAAGAAPAAPARPGGPLKP